MLIRNATVDDCKAIATVKVNSYRTAYASLMPAEYLANFSIDEQDKRKNTRFYPGYPVHLCLNR